MQAPVKRKPVQNIKSVTRSEFAEKIKIVVYLEVLLKGLFG